MACKLGFRTRIFLASASNAGVQFMSSIMFAVGGPLFQEQFHVPSSEVAIILAVVIPFSGVFTQPIVGAWSDRLMSRHGRRRPFILFGSIVCSLGMLLLAFSNLLGLACGDVAAGTSSSDHVWGISFAILGLVVMNVAANVVQGPARALIGDLSPATKQQIAQALVTTSQMVTAIVAPLIGVALSYTNDTYQWLFLIGAVVMLTTGVVTTIFGVEKSSLVYVASTPISAEIVPGGPEVLVAHLEPAGGRFVVWSVFSTLRSTPKALLRVLAAFFLSYCAFAPFLILDTLWFARNVYKGHPGDALFQQGVRMSLYNSAAFSFVSLLFSLVLPFLIGPPVGVKAVWLLTTVLSATCYGLFLIVQDVIAAFAINAGVALNFCVFNTVPFALIPIFCSSTRDTGLYVGLFNSAAMIAQGVVNLIASGVLQLASQDVSWGVALGVPFGFLAAVAVVFLPNADAERQALLSRSVNVTAPYRSVPGTASQAATSSESEYGSSTDTDNEISDLK